MKQSNLTGDLGCLIIRVMIGVVFIFHGSQKLFGWFEGPGLMEFAKGLEGLQIPYPAYACVLASGAELVGGLALITGLGMRLMIVPMIFTMGVACYSAHAHTFSMHQGGIEFPLTLGVVMIGLLLIGPGRFRLPDFTAWAGRAELPEIGGASDQRRGRSRGHEQPVGQQHGMQQAGQTIGQNLGRSVREMAGDTVAAGAAALSQTAQGAPRRAPKRKNNRQPIGQIATEG